MFLRQNTIMNSTKEQLIPQMPLSCQTETSIFTLMKMRTHETAVRQGLKTSHKPRNHKMDLVLIQDGDQNEAEIFRKIRRFSLAGCSIQAKPNEIFGVKMELVEGLKNRPIFKRTFHAHESTSLTDLVTVLYADKIMTYWNYTGV